MHDVRTQGGFSLLETLVALGLFSVLIVGSLALTQSSLKAQQTAVQSAALTDFASYLVQASANGAGCVDRFQRRIAGGQPSYERITLNPASTHQGAVTPIDQVRVGTMTWTRGQNLTPNVRITDLALVTATAWSTQGSMSNAVHRLQVTFDATGANGLSRKTLTAGSYSLGVNATGALTECNGHASSGTASSSTALTAEQMCAKIAGYAWNAGTQVCAPTEAQGESELIAACKRLFGTWDTATGSCQEYAGQAARAVIYRGDPGNTVAFGNGNGIFHTEQGDGNISITWKSGPRSAIISKIRSNNWPCTGNSTNSQNTCYPGAECAPGWEVQGCFSYVDGTDNDITTLGRQGCFSNDLRQTGNPHVSLEIVCKKALPTLSEVTTTGPTL